METTDYPELDGGDWLLDWLFQAGPVSSNGMGAIGLTWADLYAWREMTGTLISGMEAKLLKRLSTVYANALHASTDPDHPAYWMGTDLLEARQRSMATAEQGIASVFGAMAKKGAK